MYIFRFLNSLSSLITPLTLSMVDWEGPDPDEEAATPGLVAAFSLLQTLPRLHTLCLTFFPAFMEESSSWVDDPSTGLALQLAVLETIAAQGQSLSLKSLTINNLTPFPNALFDREDFLALFPALTHLWLTTASDTALEGAVYQEPIVEFWGTTIPTRFLAPAHALTSLALHSDLDIGPQPGFSFGDLTYPHLETLSLEYIIFDASVGTEAFLLRHSGTLRSLTLRKCKLAIEELEDSDDAPERVWADVWGALAEGLPRLEVLEVVPLREGEDEPDGNPGGQEMWYASEDPGWGWMPYHGEASTRVPGDEDDAAALEAFRAVVRSRKKARG